MTTGQPPDRPTVAISQSEIFNARLQQIIDGIAAQRVSEAITAERVATQTKEGFDRLELSLSRVVDEVNTNGVRITKLEESRASNSERVKKLAGESSNADLSNEAALAGEIVARTTLEAKVDELTKSQSVQLAILGRLDKVASNPQVKIILAVLATAATTWLASKSLK